MILLFDNLYNLVKDDLNQRLFDPKNLELLKQLMKTLVGMTVHLQVNSDSQYYRINESVMCVKSATFIGGKISIKTTTQNIDFHAVGIIVTAQPNHIMITAPNSKEVGSMLIIIITRDENPATWGDIVFCYVKNALPVAKSPTAVQTVVNGSAPIAKLT